MLMSVCSISPVMGSEARKDQSLQAIPLCRVIANAPKYDGKLIEVRGLYRFVIHGSILMDRGCPGNVASLRGTPGSKDNKRALSVMRSQAKKDQFQPIEVVLRGIFRVAHEGQCFGQYCASYEIEITELISATKVPTG